MVGWVICWQADHALPWMLCRPLKPGSPEIGQRRGTLCCLADDSGSSGCLVQSAQPPFDSARSQQMARGVQQGWDSCRNSKSIGASLLHLQTLLDQGHRQ